MFNNITSDKELLKEKKILEFLDNNTDVCDEMLNDKFKHLSVADYEYCSDEAVDELGLDDELINQLVEDYVVQIIKSKALFLKYLDEIKEQSLSGKKVDYIKFRELAHKNLGVARNLRIDDAQKIIYELMTEDDLEHLGECLELLIGCAIKLKPRLAYETLNLIEVKSSL